MASHRHTHARASAQSSTRFATPLVATRGSVFESKTWTSIASFADHDAAITGVGFGRSASMLVASAANGVVKHYGPASQ